MMFDQSTPRLYSVSKNILNYLVCFSSNWYNSVILDGETQAYETNQRDVIESIAK